MELSGSFASSAISGLSVTHDRTSTYEKPGGPRLSQVFIPQRFTIF